MAKKILITATAAALVSVSLFLSGCSDSTGSNAAKTSNDNQAAIVSNANTSVNTTPANNVSPANMSNSVNMTNAVNTANASAAPNANRSNAQAMKEPTPQYGSGANDLMLFTRLRNALSADKDLQTYVVIEVKEGIVTLSGKAASAEKKAQAEQLIKAVDGVKSVKNNITVSK